MKNVFSRSWELTKLSFDIIKKDKEMIWFPILAGMFSIVYIFAMVFPAIISEILATAEIKAIGFTEILIVFLTYLGLSFIATFFNMCVVYTAKKKIRREKCHFY